MWEYIYAEVRDEDYKDVIKVLNSYGVSGWEFTGHIQDTGYSTQYLMKRSIGGNRTH